MALFSFLGKDKQQSTLNQGLQKTKSGLMGRIGKLLTGKSVVDSEILDELEEVLISADIGVKTTLKIIERLEKRVAQEKYRNAEELSQLLKEEIAALLDQKPSSHSDISAHKPYVILVVGVNGVGKTTTIGKLAWNFKQAGFKVVLGAADTFRAAAVEQLQMWGKRVGVAVVSKGMNTDPSSVAFDAVKEAVESQADLVIIDTAGRLHTKINLMQELSKIKRVIEKVIPGAPHEVLLVLDGSTGQNALIQAREFTKATDVTSLAITKLDGTAKGGVVIGISDEFQIPVKYIGVGEKPEDLQEFNSIQFVESLFSKN